MCNGARRQQGDKERHLLRLDKDKECDRLTEQIDQRLREIASKQSVWLKSSRKQLLNMGTLLLHKMAGSC